MASASSLLEDTRFWVSVTYIFLPSNFVVSRMGFRFTFKVDIISFFDIWSFELRSKWKLNLRFVYKNSIKLLSTPCI